VELNAGLEFFLPAAVAVDSVDPDTLYVVGAGSYFGVYKSTNGGDTWTGLDLGAFVNGTAVAVDPTDPLTVYVGARGNGIFKSVDGGTTWSSSSLPRFFSRIVVDATEPSRLYVAAGDVYKSVDGGATWTGKGLLGINDVAIDPNDPMALYAASRVQGIYVSADAGETWTLLADPSLSNLLVEVVLTAGGTVPAGPMIASAAASETFLWAGTQGEGGRSGVFRSSIGGSSPTTSTTTSTLPGAGSGLPLSGRKLVLRDNADATRRVIRALSRDPAIDLGAGNGSGDDPVQTAGSTLSVRTADGCDAACDTTYELTGTWSYVGAPGAGSGYRYQNAIGPVRTIVIRAGKMLKVVGKGALGHRLAANPSPVQVVLTTGSRKYCMTFGGTIAFRSGRVFKALDAAAPVTCP
jgi:hypothetical protein